MLHTRAHRCMRTCTFDQCRCFGWCPRNRGTPAQGTDDEIVSFLFTLLTRTLLFPLSTRLDSTWQAWGGIFVFGGRGTLFRIASLLSPVVPSPPPCKLAAAYWDGETPSCTTCSLGNCSAGQIEETCSLTRDSSCVDCDSSLLLEGEVWASKFNCSRAVCETGKAPNVERSACVETVGIPFPPLDPFEYFES